MPAPRIQATLQADRRNTVRYAASVTLYVSTRTGVPIAGEATNISRSGFRMHSPIMLQRGEKVWVRIRGTIKRRAFVAWVDGANAGCQFLRPLKDEMLERFLGS